MEKTITVLAIIAIIGTLGVLSALSFSIQSANAEVEQEIESEHNIGFEREYFTSDTIPDDLMADNLRAAAQGENIFGVDVVTNPFPNIFALEIGHRPFGLADE
jgi:hypothetical protein